MSLSGAFSSQKSKTSQTSQQDPWDVTIPALKDLVGKVQGLIGQNPGATPGQTAAFDQLKANAANAGRFAPQIDDLAGDLLNTQSQSGRVNDEFADYKQRLTPVADGANLDIMNNPYLAKMIQSVSDDAAHRVNTSWAAGGRAGSGGNQRGVGYGVTSATLPLLLQQFNTEQGRTDAATRDLFTGGNTAAGAIASLDQLASGERIKGIDVGKAAIEAENAGPTAVLNLEEQMKNLPADYLAKLASILFPAGQLGQQSSGTGTSKTSGFSLGGGVKVV